MSGPSPRVLEGKCILENERVDQFFSLNFFSLRENLKMDQRRKIVQEIIEHSSSRVVLRNFSANAKYDIKNSRFSAADLFHMFNRLLRSLKDTKFFYNTDEDPFLDQIQCVIDSVSWIKPERIVHPAIVNHPLIRLFHDVTVEILTRWRESDFRLNIKQTNIFYGLVLIFLRAAQSDPENSHKINRVIIRNTLASRELLQAIRRHAYEGIINKRGLTDDPNVSTLALLAVEVLEGGKFYYSLDKNRTVNDDRSYILFVTFDS